MFSPHKCRRWRFGLIVAAVTLGAFGGRAAALGPDVTVLIDEASMLRLERPAAEIIIGNPSIADVSMQSGKVLVITGKSFGETNLIVLDAQGKAIINRKVSVQQQGRGLVTMYRGSARSSYYCAPKCSSPLVIGDNPDYFEAIAKQIQTKQTMGQSSAEGGAYKE